MKSRRFRRLRPLLILVLLALAGLLLFFILRPGQASKPDIGGGGVYPSGLAASGKKKVPAVTDMGSAHTTSQASEYCRNFSGHQTGSSAHTTSQASGVSGSYSVTPVAGAADSIKAAPPQDSATGSDLFEAISGHKEHHRKDTYINPAKNAGQN